MKGLRVIGWGALLGMALGAVPLRAQTLSVPLSLEQRYRELSNAIDPAAIRRHVEYFASLGSRVTGYPGCDQAAAYIREYWSALGLPVEVEEFTVTVPVDHGATAQAFTPEGKPIGKPVALYPLWPNLVRTSQLPPEGLQGPLVYGGYSEMRDYNGQEVEGSIALVEFNCGNQWLNAARLGAAAVIFIEPEDTIRGEAEAKFISIPIDFPRFYISRRDADYLLTLVEMTPGVEVRLHCRMTWEQRRAMNIIATIPGVDSALSDQIVILQAYYDSMSVVPRLAPGAESACGIAFLLELARYYKANPPGRTLMLLATAGHFEALAGVRAFIERHFPQLQDGTFKVSLFAALDLSSRTDGVGIFYKGWFYNQREDIQRDFSDLARVCRENAERIAFVLGVPKERAFADGVNPVQGKSWRDFIPGKVAFESEAFTLGGGMGVALATINDGRPKVDTPFDLPHWMNFDNLAKQARFLSCLINDILTDPAMPVREQPRLSRMSVRGGFAELGGRVAEFDPRESFIPDKPVPGALVVVQNPNKTLMGVRGHFIQMVEGDEATFEFDGIAPVSAYGGRPKTLVEAYALDPRTGEIRYAPDRGVNGAEAYPIEIEFNLPRKELTVVVFPCVATALFELIDPLTMEALVTIDIYDAETNAHPRMYGYALAKPEPWISHVDTTAVVFSTPASRFKVIMGAGPAAKRLLLIRSELKPGGFGGFDKEAAEGKGYPPVRAIYHTPLRVAQDIWNIDHFRMENLRRFRIINQILDDLHSRAAEELKEAQKALKERRYDAFSSHARAAWGYEIRAYPDVQKTADDVVKGVIFYLALLLPFSFFTERLIFAFPDIRKQILGVFGIFIGIFIVFALVHPAFRITMNPFIILLAFIMLALSILVITIVTRKFEEQLKEMQRGTMGRHRADIGRWGVAAAAFSLGISNMRRRKLRTFLTCLTLVLLTFTVLSFTSVVSTIRFNVVPAPGAPLYNGIMIRHAIWRPLQEQAYRVLWDAFAPQRAVAGRAWFFTAELGEQSFINLTCSKSDKDYDAKAIVGMTAEEAQVTRIHECLRAGRWFLPGERYACIIPEGVADAFNITDEDIGKVTLQFNGIHFQLVGIFDNNLLKQREDLDGEMLTPVDFIMMQRLQGQMGAQSAQEAEAGFREYLHLAPDSVIFVPFDTLINLGGTLRSVAVNFVTPEEVRMVLDKVMRRIGFNLYAGQGDRIYKYSSIAATSISGVMDLVIPILIAALIVLNTMLGAVYERLKEIGIFSSLGLAPTHVAILFIAEAFVYSILGAILGYLLGQVVAKLIAVTGLLPGLSLNYSSLSAIISISIVILVVFLSTLYPAKKASELATPGVERRWQVPEPVGDLWRIRLPFSVSGNQGVALNRFLAEWFQAYEEYSIGDFVTEETRLEEATFEHGKGFRLSLMAWLAPFDLGVSQRVELLTIPSTMEDVYDIDLVIHRESGDVSSWKRVNRRFLNTLRKQFLIWRTLSEEERISYLTGAEESTEGGPASSLAPQPA